MRGAPPSPATDLSASPQPEDRALAPLLRTHEAPRTGKRARSVRHGIGSAVWVCWSLPVKQDADGFSDRDRPCAVLFSFIGDEGSSPRGRGRRLPHPCPCCSQRVCNASASVHGSWRGLRVSLVGDPPPALPGDPPRGTGHRALAGSLLLGPSWPFSAVLVLSSEAVKSPAFLVRNSETPQPHGKEQRYHKERGPRGASGLARHVSPAAAQRGILALEGK